MIDANWLQSVIKVGGDRGFVMADDQDNLVVVTAAHCLPHLPEAHPGSGNWERSYEQLLGRLGDEPSIAAEALFVDPVADIAILGTPITRRCGSRPRLSMGWSNPLRRCRWQTGFRA